MVENGFSHRLESFPLCVFAVFLSLFSSANPLIEHGLMQIDLRFSVQTISDLQRTLFWLLIACAIWPFIHRRIRRTPVRESETFHRCRRRAVRVRLSVRRAGDVALADPVQTRLFAPPDRA